MPHPCHVVLQDSHAAGLESELAPFIDPPLSLAELRLGCLALQAQCLANQVGGLAGALGLVEGGLAGTLE